MSKFGQWDIAQTDDEYVDLEYWLPDMQVGEACLGGTVRVTACLDPQPLDALYSTLQLSTLNGPVADGKDVVAREQARKHGLLRWLDELEVADQINGWTIARTASEIVARYDLPPVRELQPYVLITLNRADGSFVGTVSIADGRDTLTLRDVADRGLIGLYEDLCRLAVTNA